MSLTDVILESKTGCCSKDFYDETKALKGFVAKHARFIDVSENKYLQDKSISVQDETSYDRHLIYVLNGSGSIKLEDIRTGLDKNYVLKSGDRLLLPTDIAYTLELASGSRVFKFTEKNRPRATTFSNIYESNIF